MQNAKRDEAQRQALTASGTKEHSKAWGFLLICGIFEVVWAYTMKLSDGFTNPLFTLITLAILAANLFLLEKPVSVLGIGVSYGVFTGLGIVGTTIVGIVGLGESADPVKIACIAVLLIGVVGLKYCDSKEAAQKASNLMNQQKNRRNNKGLSPQASSGSSEGPGDAS